MPEMAKLIEVEREGDKVSLRVDGEEFPWHITDQGVATSMPRPDVGLPTASFTVIAEHVEVRDDRRQRGTTDPEEIARWFGDCRKDTTLPPRRDPTGPLARAEAARDQAEELLDNAQKALQDTHDTMERLRAELDLERAERRLERASQS